MAVPKNQGPKNQDAVATTPPLKPLSRKQKRDLYRSTLFDKKEECLGLNRRRCMKKKAQGCIYKHNAYCDDEDAPLQFAICSEILWKNACRKVQPSSGSLCRWSMGACDVKGLYNPSIVGAQPPAGTK